MNTQGNNARGSAACLGVKNTAEVKGETARMV